MKNPLEALIAILATILFLGVWTDIAVTQTGWLRYLAIIIDIGALGGIMVYLYDQIR